MSWPVNNIISADVLPVIVTDLDGTLLDHHDYSWKAALPALALLQEKQIPLVFNSSKTAAEMRAIRQSLDNHEPYVVENGGGICTGDDEAAFITLGGSRENIREVLTSLRQSMGYRFTGFADMSVDELVEHTGLGESEARAAMDRQFTEPLLWQDEESRLAGFSRELSSHGLCLVRGGRFWHVSAPSDKGKAFDWLRSHYSAGNASVHFIALGDGGNDVPMLEVADTAVLIPSPVNPLPVVNNRNLLVPAHCGPEGWNEALLALLAGYGAEQDPANAGKIARNHG